MSSNPNKYHIRTWNFYTRQGNWNWLPCKFYWQFNRIYRSCQH